jgi:hypothetical protein
LVLEVRLGSHCQWNVTRVAAASSMTKQQGELLKLHSLKENDIINRATAAQDWDWSDWGKSTNGFLKNWKASTGKSGTSFFSTHRSRLCQSIRLVRAFGAPNQALEVKIRKKTIANCLYIDQQRVNCMLSEHRSF